MNKKVCKDAHKYGILLTHLSIHLHRHSAPPKTSAWYQYHQEAGEVKKREDRHIDKQTNCQKIGLTILCIK